MTNEAEPVLNCQGHFTGTAAEDSRNTCSSSDVDQYLRVMKALQFGD
jgi:hypothetical protein